MWDTIGYRNECRLFKLSKLIFIAKALEAQLRNYPSWMLTGGIEAEKLDIVNEIIEEKFNETITI